MGSPPPMRGKASADSPLAYRSRITPAYAGKRKRKPNGMLQSKDHPRLCGEKVTAGSSWFRLAGSPPPMRGKEGGKLCAIIMPRITPAYAGKSYRSESTLHSRPDHPRLCGEKTMSSVFSTADTGSPPPMRGKEAKDRAKTFWGGITPAYAGKSITMAMLVTSGKDHPRLCGEKFSIHCKVICRKGSPPPMRGKAISAAPGDHIFRITPAYAGKSVRWFPARYGIRDHPRLCGEKLLMDTFVTSSCRITPAYAGKSFFGTMIGIPKQDHPRLCGEKKRKYGKRSHISGSPPPMRGKAARILCWNTTSRITPAYAGKRVSLTLVRLPSAGSPPPMRGKVHGYLCDSAVRRITPAYAGKSDRQSVLRSAYVGSPPAYAGKSFLFTENHTTHQDHPRLCGEK